MCISFLCTIVELSWVMLSLSKQTRAGGGGANWATFLTSSLCLPPMSSPHHGWMDMIWDLIWLLSLHGVDSLADLCILLWRQALYSIGISLIPQRIVIGACDLQTPSDCTFFFCFGLRFSKVWVFLPMGIDNAVVRPFAVLRLFRVVKLGRLIRKYRRLKILWNLFQATALAKSLKNQKDYALPRMHFYRHIYSIIWYIYIMIFYVHM